MKQTHSHRFALPGWLSRSGQKPNRSARVLFIVLAPFIAFIIMNAIAAVWVEGTIYPGVSVAGKNLSGLTRTQAEGALQAMPLARHYRVTVGDRVFEATNDQLGAEYDISATVDMAYSLGRQSNIALLGLWQAPREGQLAFSYRIDQHRLNKFTDQVVSSVGTSPKNAGVIVRDGSIVTIAAEPGLQIDAGKLTRLISNSLGNATDQAFSLYPESVDAPIQENDTTYARTQVQILLARQLSYDYAGRTFTPTPTDIGHWIAVGPEADKHNSDLVVSINEQEVRGYIQSLANDINQSPVSKKVTVKNGQSATDREGQDGLALDQDNAVQATIAAMQSSSSLSTAIDLKTNPVAFKTETYRTTSLDSPKYIEVNLSRQQAWAYENGQVVYSTPITSGATGAGYPTVTGLFSVYYKATNTYLNGRQYGYNYNVFVKYWMPFYSGYGLHDASWRSSFGGSDYYYGGSHGCVNLPDAAAAFLYDWASVGTPVWVHT